MSVSTIRNGELVITEGRYHNLSWSEDLVFKRTSWYYELSLLYDFLIAEVPINSNYRRWLLPGEAISANNCAKLYIAGVYASRDRRVNSNDIWRAFDTNKLQFTNVNGFYRNLSFSSKFITNSFSSYKFWGICLKNDNEQIPVKFSFPGYTEKQILL